MEINIGDIVEKYRIEARLGEGGMAIVYQVLHTTLNTHCALKVLKVAHPSVRDRMIREAQYQAQLRHPNIVTVTDVLDVNGSPGLIMEYIDGVTLSQWIKGKRPSVTECEMVFLQILDALEEAHSKSIIHRDLKPSNIIIQEKRGRVIPKVCDFGLAKIIEEDDQNHTRTGIAMGTPSYMAPEQVRNAKNVDRRADIFSMGALFYEMITQRRAFFGADTLELLNAVAMHPHVSPDKYVDNLPKRIVSAINGALTKSANQRIPNCTVFREVLTGEREWAFSDADLSLVPQTIHNPHLSDSVENLATIDAVKFNSDSTLSIETPFSKMGQETLPPQIQRTGGSGSGLSGHHPSNRTEFVPSTALQNATSSVEPPPPKTADPTLFPNDVIQPPPLSPNEDQEAIGALETKDPPSLIELEPIEQPRAKSFSTIGAIANGIALGLLFVGVGFTVWKSISAGDTENPSIKGDSHVPRTDMTTVQPSEPPPEETKAPNTQITKQAQKSSDRSNANSKSKAKSNNRAVPDKKIPNQIKSKTKTKEKKTPKSPKAKVPEIKKTPEVKNVRFTFSGADRLELVNRKTKKTYTKSAPPGLYTIRASFPNHPMAPRGAVELKAGRTKNIQCFPDFTKCR